MTRSFLVALAVVLIANPWRGASVPQDAESPSATVAPAPAVEASVPADQDLKAVIEGIDPLLVGRNVITGAPPLDQTGPGFVELESRFGAEAADATWSRGMEARILDEVAQVSGLKLVSLDTECRATVCRLKLFHPPGTDTRPSLSTLVPIANGIGFAHVMHVATLGENRVPISVLYLQRPPPSAEFAR